MKTVDIFIKSHKPDFWLLQLALQTISKNVIGYNNIILIIPEQDKHEFDTRYLPERTLIHYVVDQFPGWLFQQYLKMVAYKYCYSDYIMFSDSDCLFDHPIDLQEFIVDDKPEILYTSWDKVGDAIAWKEPTEKFMKEPVQWEFMRRNNCIYHRNTLIAISQYEPNLEHLIMGSGKWSEFNCFGAYAYKNERDNYTWVNTDDWTFVPAKSLQVWSHSSKAADADTLHLREYIRVLESVLKAFGIKVPE